jgi:hypothetical protein
MFDSRVTTPLSRSNVALLFVPPRNFYQNNMNSLTLNSFLVICKPLSSPWLSQAHSADCLLDSYVSEIASPSGSPSHARKHGARRTASHFVDSSSLDWFLAIGTLHKTVPMGLLPEPQNGLVGRRPTLLPSQAQGTSWRRVVRGVHRMPRSN